MNYRVMFDPANLGAGTGIEVTTAAVDTDEGILGTLKKARAELDDRMNRHIASVRKVKNEWAKVADEKLPRDKAALDAELEA